MKKNKDLKFRVRAVPNANSLDEALIKEDFIKLTEAAQAKTSRRRSLSAALQTGTKENEVRVPSLTKTEIHNKGSEKGGHRKHETEHETVVILSEYIDEQQKLLDKYDDITMGLIKVIEKQSAMIDGYQKVIGLVLYNGNGERA